LRLKKQKANHGWLQGKLMAYPLVPQEEATIKAFIVRQRRERFLELLPNPKHRHKITRSLAHPNPQWFDARFVRRIPPAENNPVSIARLLREKGAGSKCWAISEDRTIDAREVNLEDILDEIVGREIGTILSCIPGKLAFVESEDGRFILEK
jgi:hypothetical protein